ncbi:MAG: hypothetical protein EPN21_16600 [Methylococcaceae bacterium]|nr:MAG: hypothetical protein EPN21_16600 [Methylococcaceae bacterium]
MLDDTFEWDNNKATLNWRAHGVAFLHDGLKNMSKSTITAKMRTDGRVVEVLADGSERPFAEIPLRPMTEAEIEAAARADPDAQPLTEADFMRANIFYGCTKHGPA